MLTFSYQDVHIHCVSSVRNLLSHSSIWNASYIFCLFVPSMVPLWKVTSMAQMNAQLWVIIVILEQNRRPGSRSPIQQSTRVHWLVWGWKDNPFELYCYCFSNYWTPLQDMTSFLTLQMLRFIINKTKWGTITTLRYLAFFFFFGIFVFYLLVCQFVLDCKYCDSKSNRKYSDFRFFNCLNAPF